MNPTKRTPFGYLTIFCCGTLLLVVFLLQPVPVMAQWTTPDANQNISNTNSGNVGVKTTTPEFPLQVNNSSSNVLGTVFTGSLSSTSGAGIQALTTGTPSRAAISDYQSEHYFEWQPLVHGTKCEQRQCEIHCSEQCDLQRFRHRFD